jgi:hypothetical protein
MARTARSAKCDGCDAAASALVWFAMKRVTALALLAIAPAVFSACGGSGSQQRTPQSRLIVPGQSVGGIRLGEPRGSVEKALGRGTSKRRGLVRYFGGRLLVNYWFHDGLTTRVEGLETRWGGFHTRSGVHVGSSRQELRALHVTCRNGECSRAAGGMPDAPGTVFTMRHGKVVQIDVFYG